jgi:chloride channel 3/4/5
MPSDYETAGEHTPLLHPNRVSQLQHEHDEEAHSIIASSVTKEEQDLAGSTIGERLPYNDYTTIDWLHDLVFPSSTFAIEAFTARFQS